MFGRRPLASITPRAACDRFFSGELVLVDVRSHAEYERLRVPRAIHIPLLEMGGRVGELPAGHPVAFLCRTGHRSALVARAVGRRRGDVLNVTGGMNAWLAADLPTSTCPCPGRSPRRSTFQ
jgi:rhodanese-related sulfurtransferase